MTAPTWELRIAVSAVRVGQEKKAPAIAEARGLSAMLSKTLPRVRPGPPSVITEGTEIIGRAKPEAVHVAQPRTGRRKSKDRVDHGSAASSPRAYIGPFAARVHEVSQRKARYPTQIQTSQDTRSRHDTVM